MPSVGTPSLDHVPPPGTIPPHPPYLFDPSLVEERIRSLPATERLVHRRKRTGGPSQAFPRLLKTDSEILRILGRANLYDHLDDLLESLERCLGSGWDAHQLSTTSRHEFASLMSDLHVAEHCMLQGFTVESPLGATIEGRKPDLFIRQGDMEAVIEVFRPHEIPAFHSFLGDVATLLMEADIALDFRGDVQLGCAADFDGADRLASLWHPVDLNEALVPLYEAALERLGAALAALEPADTRAIVQEWSDENVRLVVTLDDIGLSSGREPAREVWTGQSYGGYDPVEMLKRLVQPIAAKAARRQAGEPGPRSRVLICDVSATVVAAHLDEPQRRTAFVGVLEKGLESCLGRDYDVIALCQQRGWSRALRLDFAVHDGREAVVGELFGPVRAPD